MGEVYFKITSDNPKDYNRNQKFLKNHFILIYCLEVIVLALYLFEIAHYKKIISIIDDFNLVMISCIMFFAAILGALIIYHFLKYYIFFIKMKISLVKKKWTWKRVLFAIQHIFTMVIGASYLVIILVEYILYCIKN